MILRREIQMFKVFFSESNQVGLRHKGNKCNKANVEKDRGFHWSLNSRCCPHRRNLPSTAKPSSDYWCNRASNEAGHANGNQRKGVCESKRGEFYVTGDYTFTWEIHSCLYYCSGTIKWEINCVEISSFLFLRGFSTWKTWGVEKLITPTPRNAWNQTAFSTFRFDTRFQLFGLFLNLFEFYAMPVSKVLVR